MRCSETERQIMFERQAKHILKKRAKREKKLRTKLIRRDRGTWRNVVKKTETGFTGDRKVHRAG